MKWGQTCLDDAFHGLDRKGMLSRFSHVQLFATPWTIACQTSLSMSILQARILEWVAISSSRGSSQGSNPGLFCLLNW